MASAWSAVRASMVGAVVALAACTAEEPPAARSDSAAAGSAWTISDQGYGPVKIGMTPEEASAAFGRPLTALGGDEDESCTYVFPDGDVDSEIAFMVTDGRIARVDVDQPGIATMAGVQVGDSEEDAQARYPAAEVQPHKYGDPRDHYLVTTAADGTHALVLETWDGKVSYIRAGKLPEAEYVEGCS